MTGAVQISFIAGQELDKLSRDKLVDLKQGDRLEGKVLETRDGKTLVDFGKFQARLEMPLPVQKGDVIAVSVMEKIPRIVLKLEQLQSNGEIIQFNSPSRGAGETPVLTAGRLNAETIQFLQQETQTVAASHEQQALYSKNPSASAPDIREALEQLKQILEHVQSGQNRGAADVMEKLRDLLGALKRYGDALDLGRQIVEPVRRLEHEFGGNDAGADPRLKELIGRIAASADKLSGLETLGRLPQARIIIQDELLPALKELDSLLRAGEANQSPATSGSSPTPPGEIRGEVAALLNAVENTMRVLPQSIEVSGLSPNDWAAIRRQTDQLVQLLRKTPIPPDPETADAIRRLTETAGDMTRLQFSAGSRELLSVLAEKIRPDLLQVKFFFENAFLPPSPEAHRGAADIKNAVNQLLETITDALRQLPEPLKTDPAIQTLVKEIQNIREALENQTEQLHSGSSIAKGVEQLVHRLDRGEVGAEPNLARLLETLSNIAVKIREIRQPAALPELKTILENELQPALNELKTLIPGDFPENVPTPAKREMSEFIQTLEKEIRLALEKLPDRIASSDERQRVVRDIDAVLEKISHFSTPSGASSDPDIDALFENIKLALTQLRQNIQSGKPLFDFTTHVRDVFSHLRLNFEAGDLRDGLNQNIQQLETWTQSLRNSPLAQDKEITQLLLSLKEMLQTIQQLRESGQTRQIAEFFQQQVIPRMDAVKQLLSHPRFSQDPEIRQIAAPLMRAAEVLSTQALEFSQRVTEGDPLEHFLQKADTLSPEIRDALAQMPASLRTPENIQRITQAIREILAQTEPSSSVASRESFPASTAASALPPEVREMLSMMRAHFEPLDISENAIKLASRLKSMVENSGLFFEKKMEEAIQNINSVAARLSGVDNLGRMPEIRSIIADDLKPNLLKLQDFFNRNNPADDPVRRETAETLRKAVDELINNISGQQSRAQEPLSQTQPQQQNQMVFFSFQLPIKGQDEAHLKVFYNKKRANGPVDDFKLSLLLDMERLGSVRTDFANSGRNLTITFYVENDGIKKLIDQHLHQIAKPLEGEFDSLAISVKVSREKIAEFHSDASTPDIISETAVDVKV